MTSFDVFKKKWSYFVLMTIRDNPGITKIDLMREGNAHSIFNITCELHRIGLIKYVSDPDDRNGKKGMWNCIHMYLTDKGQKVAAYLEKIANELDEKP